MTGQSSAHGAKSQTAAGGADGALVQRPGYVTAQERTWLERPSAARLN